MCPCSLQTYMLLQRTVNTLMVYCRDKTYIELLFIDFVCYEMDAGCLKLSNVFKFHHEGLLCCSHTLYPVIAIKRSLFSSIDSASSDIPLHTENIFLI